MEHDDHGFSHAERVHEDHRNAEHITSAIRHAESGVHLPRGEAVKLAVVGVGNAGCRLVNQILEAEQTTGRNLCNGNTLLINSTEPTFDATAHVPEARRLTIGDVYWEADGTDIDGDPDLAAEIAREEKNDIIRAFDHIEFHEVDGILVIAGLGRGTGGGAGAVVIDHLKAICDEPVYAVGVLPADSEGEQEALTAARSLQSFVSKADNVIAFDNDAWLDGERPTGGALDNRPEDDTADDEAPPSRPESDGSGYAAVNAALAERLVALFAAGEFREPSAEEYRMDPSDIIRALDTGGVSTIGYASFDLPQPGRLRSWVRALSDRFAWIPEPSWASATPRGDEDTPTDAAKINRLVREAARSKLTLPCEVSSAERALVVLSGPSKTVSRQGFEGGRYWLEKEADIVDVMAGDELNERATALTAVVLLSNVTDVDRITEIQETAVEHQQSLRTEGKQYGTARSE
ncbi:Tubulin/FtsZ GTPase [Haloferax elongans ATCC BAA-1513]|uniref:Tubulin-like protein CetZ n=1 Tax=Haloferax elongans ATCC BAA-1513 TaxID=1230453 RepID=M0HG48_HALEO|nr:tubulin/FtsZ family protein [Haloferax elongans]ELZ82727.1 Tubulin/FtsZ GTPase [Haloferax elongans ATCC BAA-1513]